MNIEHYNGTPLYTLDSKGKTRIWKAESNLILNNDGHIIITIKHGVDGSDRIQSKIRTVKSGKNKGRSNETTIEEQTLLEIKSLYQKQLDDGYVFDLQKYQEPLRPQLAHVYEKRKHTVKFDYKHPTATSDYSNRYYASRKLDGIRCFIFISDGKVIKFESRTGKPFKYFKHIAEVIEKGLSDSDKDKNIILDGELFNKNIPFVVLCSLINSDDYVETELDEINYNTNQVQFHCYDRIDLDNKDVDYFTRFIDITIPSDDINVFKVQNKIVKSENDLVILGKQWIDEGYEGLMLRTGWASYEFGKRSNNLLKYKIMLDDEFLILDITDSENEPGQPRFVVQINKEKNINCDVRMKGDKKDNEKYLINKKDYIGKYLTVQYQTISAHGNLQFPVGLSIREGEVINDVFVPSI